MAKYGAFDLMRKQTESLYDSICDITEYRSGDGVINNTVAVLVAEAIPCRVSYKNSPAVDKTDAGAALAQSIQLIINPDITIKPGSLITVKRNGITTEYNASGQPARYISHQEITLNLKEEYA